MEPGYYGYQEGNCHVVRSKKAFRKKLRTHIVLINRLKQKERKKATIVTMTSAKRGGSETCMCS